MQANAGGKDYADPREKSIARVCAVIWAGKKGTPNPNLTHLARFVPPPARRPLLLPRLCPCALAAGGGRRRRCLGGALITATILLRAARIMLSLQPLPFRAIYPPHEVIQ